MFALIAALLFLLALLGVAIGSVDLVTAGLLFVALHLVVGTRFDVFGRRD